MAATPDSTLLFLTIDRKAIETSNIKDMEDTIKYFIKNGVKNYKNKLVIQVDGYDDDPREIFEIPAVKAYYTKVFAKFPHLLYFLSPYQNSDAWVLCCLCDSYQITNKAGAQDMNLKMKFDDSLINYLIDRTVFFMRNIGETARTILAMRVRYAGMML
ncbi:hypothetical protein [Clostridium thermarum]|uniref:hypothetical protein n=1 Tax=Clostridium thermarum TaxID=1716543 RepID=UPI001122BD1F|nr:hypothetical protein [Clostridium thermarum]